MVQRARMAVSVVLAAATMLSACGPTPSEVALNTAAQDCAAGYGPACDVLPQISAQAQVERSQQDAAATVAGVVGAAALVGGVAAAASSDRGYYRGGRYWRGRGYGYRPYRRW